jgi:hypothetical protein
MEEWKKKQPNMEPREFVETELKVIHQLFDEMKEIYPMVVIVKDDKRYQVPVSYKTSAHKDIVSQGIKDLVKRSDPDIVIYVAEAWTKVIRDKMDRIPVAISAMDPDKYEIVVVQIEFRSGEKFGCEAKIFTEGSKRWLDKFEFIQSDFSMGRFVDFFPIKRMN